MGKEVETTDEPEAASLRGSIRRIDGILGRMHEQDAWNLGTEAAVGEIRTVVDLAMKRPATNGTVIDELYRKIAKLEGAAVEHGVDVALLSSARTAAETLREIQRRQSAEVSALRGQLAQAHATQSGAIDLADDARAFLAKLAEQLVLLADCSAPIKPEIARSWSDRLVAMSGRKP